MDSSVRLKAHALWSEGSVHIFCKTIQSLYRIIPDRTRHTTYSCSNTVRWVWEVLFHPPHSPDLSPCEYDLIPKLKETLRDIRYKTVPDILQAVGRSVRNIDRTGTATGIWRLPHRWQRVVDNAGDYVEGLQKFHRYATCILVITK